jgi:hypothetical protein
LDTGDADTPNSPFGFSPKISTPVENTVEKHRVTAEVRQKPPISACFGAAKPGGARFFGARRPIAAAQ